ncbi:TolC family protein [Shewanella sp. 6_MG-2023]|uniref:TolC family protein n=1 Tax=Shewanella sp. 6_MG-2023 TaxID=3062660 RepID=UPI0026E1EA96|nr:TolC family protein [Shewanella sp. 6_MG-2023]MDO6619230.1 TolC family protein [Shewanella sp. 6_MG-2023]
MFAIKFSIKLCILIVLTSGTYSFATPSNELSKLLEISRNRLNVTQLNGTPLNDGRAFELTSSTWLTGLPSISLSYLGSLDNSNIYEQEVSLNLPIKSFGLHNSDKRLKKLTLELEGQQVALQKLYLSGLLRQSIWDYRIASVKIKQLNRKAKLLDKLYVQHKQLSDAGELPKVNILLLEREHVDIDLDQIVLKQQQSEALSLFNSVTGLSVIPQKINEQYREITEANLSIHHGINDALIQHPLWQIQSLRQQQQLLIIKSQQAGEQDSWTLSLTAKETADDQFNDQQLGLRISIPISLGSALSQSELSIWQKDHQEQSLNSERTYLELKTQTEKLAMKQQNLRKQQLLLQRGVSLSRTITEDLAKVKDQSQISYEIWLRRYMDALDTESRLLLNQITQQQLHSQQLQALGISL